MTTAHIERSLQCVRSVLVPDSHANGIHLSPRAHCGLSTRPIAASDGSASEEHEEVEDEELEEERTRKRHWEHSSDEERDSPKPAEVLSPKPTVGLRRPSEYLRHRCLLCFGGER